MKTAVMTNLRDLDIRSFTFVALSFRFPFRYPFAFFASISSRCSS